jgi:zinc transporter ZupT
MLVVLFGSEETMSFESNHHNGNKRQGRMLGVGIALGIGIGAALGVVLDNIPVGIAIGIGVGVAIGLTVDRRQEDKGDGE